MAVRANKVQESSIQQEESSEQHSKTAVSISPDTQSPSKSNKKISEQECFVILDRLEADRTLTMTVIAKEYSISHQYLGQQLAPVREKRTAIKDKLFGDRLKGMMTIRLDTHDQLNNILQEMLSDVETELKGKVSKTRKTELNKERANLVYRIGSNWIALSNTLKPLGVTVSRPGDTPVNISPVNILNIFVKKDGKSVGEDEARVIAAEELADLASYLEEKKGLSDAVEAEFEDIT